jgi:hypothetical protein
MLIAVIALLMWVKTASAAPSVVVTLQLVDPPSLSTPLPAATAWIDIRAPLGIGGPQTATALFEATVWAHFDQVHECDAPTRGIPGKRLIAKHICAIIESCSPFGGMESDWYLMACLLFSEGGGHMKKTSPTGEKTYGPYCATILEARVTSQRWSWMGCPRSDAGVIERLETDPAWAALIMRGTWQRLLEEQRGNRITALNCYKMGGEGVRRNTFSESGKRIRQPWELSPWRYFVRDLSRLACLREQLMVSGTVSRCACIPRP